MLYIYFFKENKKDICMRFTNDKDIFNSLSIAKYQTFILARFVSFKFYFNYKFKAIFYLVRSFSTRNRIINLEYVLKVGFEPITNFSQTDTLQGINLSLQINYSFFFSYKNFYGKKESVENTCSFFSIRHLTVEVYFLM